MKPWLLLPSQLAHDIAPLLLKTISPFIKKDKNEYRPFQWKGLFFRHPLGLAGGVDKSGKQCFAWEKLGASFIEVGTITPKTQTPNPGKIMDRVVKDGALWNCMGFPNPGSLLVAKSIQPFVRKKQIPLFINIGKNRDTPNEEAQEDYIKCIQLFHDSADAFVVNISSPNTKNLRDLFSEKYLSKFLKDICDSSTKPVLLKISPDMDKINIKNVIEASLAAKVSGWILTNTTTDRPKLSKELPVKGGLSGKPLAQKSFEFLESFIKILGDRKEDKLIISVGGVSNEQEVKQRLEAGADLCQAYSAIVFEGPLFFKKIVKKLKAES